MAKITNEYVKELAKQLMFEMSDQEAQDVKGEFEVLLKQLDLLESIDTTGVEEMIYPFEQPTSFMREDVVENQISQKDALLNEKRVRKDYIILPRVVK